MALHDGARPQAASEVAVEQVLLMFEEARQERASSRTAPGPGGDHDVRPVLAARRQWRGAGAGKPRPYVASTEQVWALYDAFPEHLQPAVLLGGFVGLRTAEVVGLRVIDVDFMRGIVRPVLQRAGEELKTETSRTPLPIPQELALELSAAVARWGSDFVVTDGMGGQTSTWAIERAVRAARPRIPGLPEAFRFHDLRHYLASLLIGSGLDVKVVQQRLRHGSAKTTLDTYGHLWPDSDESARAAVGAVLAARLRTD